MLSRVRHGKVLVTILACALGIALLSAVACARGGSEALSITSIPSPSPTPTPSPPKTLRHFEFLLDVTTSLEPWEVERSQQQAVAVVEQVAEPGDRLACSLISHEPFVMQPKCGPIVIPTPAPLESCPSPTPTPEPDVPNPFGTPTRAVTPTPTPIAPDRAAQCRESNRQEEARSVDAIERALDEAVTSIASLPRQQDDIATDVFAALQRVGLLFEVTPGAQHVALIWSDLLQTVERQTQVRFDLHGARVIVILMESDPEAFSAATTQWCPIFRNGNAGDVRFLHPGVSAEDIVQQILQPTGGVTTC